MCFAQLWHQRRLFLTFELGNPNVAHFCPHFSHMHFEGGILDPGLRDPQIHALVNYRAARGLCPNSSRMWPAATAA